MECKSKVVVVWRRALQVKILPMTTLKSGNNQEFGDKRSIEDNRGIGDVGGNVIIMMSWNFVCMCNP